uniref:Ig-like domain-containing protein n=1 Tax=Seriola dumerili TaxID=41447 RepID=A0A3B4UAR1_SERDU
RGWYCFHLVSLSLFVCVCVCVCVCGCVSEAGLCVVIPCSFTTSSNFIPRNLVWYKCVSTEQRCSYSDVIFNTNKNNIKIQSEFRGRVSQLEPDVSQRNCSIIINDLKESDSGSYQLRVNAVSTGSLIEVFIKVSDYFNPNLTLTQKPEVTIPPLTEGQQTTLTCTAPGLCSGSDPQITWTWRGAGEKGSHITGNITTNQRYTSTLTFTPLAEHHGMEIICKVSFTGNVTTEETVTLNVTCEFRTNCTLLSHIYILPLAVMIFTEPLISVFNFLMKALQETKLSNIILLNKLRQSSCFLFSTYHLICLYWTY